MNPFKHKKLEEFTIADCELYINKYPYGEHSAKVKRLLRELKTQKKPVATVSVCSNNKPEKVKQLDRIKEECGNKEKPIAKSVHDDNVDKFLRIIGTVIVIVIAIVIASAIEDGFVWTGPPVSLVAAFLIRAIWKKG